MRTTNLNLFERLFVEERRRLKIIPNVFGERAVLKLMFGALIRAAERGSLAERRTIVQGMIAVGTVLIKPAPTSIAIPLSLNVGRCDAAVRLNAKPSNDEQ